jgi:hypothetical protein
MAACCLQGSAQRAQLSASSNTAAAYLCCGLFPRPTSHRLCVSLQVVNGPDHPGAVGAPPSKYAPPPPLVPADLAGQQLHGWREVYLREGPEGWAKAVRAHQGLLLTDTTM